MEKSQPISGNYKNIIFGDYSTTVSKDEDINYKRSVLLIRGLYYTSTRMTPKLPAKVFEQFIVKLIDNKGELWPYEIFKYFPEYKYQLFLLQKHSDYSDLSLELQLLSENSENVRHDISLDFFNLLPKSAQYLKDNIHYIVQTSKENLAAKVIQKNAKQYITTLKEKVQAKKLLIGPAEKTIIAAGVKDLFKEIRSSLTATQENIDKISSPKNQQYYDLDYFQYLQYLEDQAYLSVSDSFIEKYNLVYYSDKVTQKLLIEVLSETFRNKQLQCCDFAMINAIFLNSKEVPFAEEVKKQIYVCKIEGHWVCCIGDPNNADSTIIDSWMGRFIDFYPTKGYRAVVVPSQDRAQRITAKSWEEVQNPGAGIITSVGKYVKFLNDHSSIWIDEIISSADIKIQGLLSDIAKTTDLMDIIYGKNPYEI